MSWENYKKRELAVHVNIARERGNDDLDDLAPARGMRWIFIWGIIILIGLMLWMSFT